MAAVMLQGTGSDVGKSVLVAGLCRLLANRGLKVLPFKPQNMSNNAAVAEGGEIGRAQALQAVACRAAPNVDMNPVLIKPQSDTGAQLVVHGKVVGTLGAADYQHRKGELLGKVLQSWQRLTAAADIVIVEGAGSPAEINLRAGDIANMGFARAAGVPVVLIGDIDRGGVIASIVGTKAVIDAEDAAMIRGFLINKFRGDVRLFDKGYAEIERRTGWPGLGVIPWLAAARQLPAEDAVVLDTAATSDGAITIAVPMLSRIANFDDFDPLAHEPGVRLMMVPPGQPLPGDAALIILPGTKATIADLAFLRAQGWDIDIAAHVRRGGAVLGICGGYQMLGQTIEDPDGVEGMAGTVTGLGLLPVTTRLTGDKRVIEVTGNSIRDGQPFAGYEIHVGQTRALSHVQPLLRLADGAMDGAVSHDGRIAGCYIHRLFDHPAQRGAWLARLGAQSDGIAQGHRVDQALDALAADLEAHVDIDRLLAIAGYRA
ncbi:adenosylcobyric acid synthase (glutamine-hydrolysing) [Blastomonas natatoria]|uniref:Cobyric acid synthase n=1 Tax=Blastomonas natatoria TaxID=34015 RepID=A0A2V3VC36_9SPHN|nr:cobyric acid synthase [Blastomonas natatoria]PXW79376.1 adenosylcobyric acid synthase (glutamine-hydrolysing) [Blastomonas natatoria]